MQSFEIQYHFKFYPYIVCLHNGFLYQLAHCPKKRTKTFRKLKYNEKRKAYYINGQLVTKKRLEQLKFKKMNNTLAKCPVPCLQTEAELQIFLSEIYTKRKIKKVAEIGSFYGGTLWFFIKNNPDIESIISIDLPIPPSDERYEEMIKSKALWDSWVDKPNFDFQKYEGDSHNKELVSVIFDKNPLRDLDMLHIDGDHSYEGVRADYENYKRLVKTGGIIVFHDVVGIPDVADFWTDIKDNPHNKTKTISVNDGWGIGVLFV